MNVAASAAFPASVTFGWTVADTPPIVTVGVIPVPLHATIPQTVLPEVTPAPNVAVSDALLAETELCAPWTKAIYTPSYVTAITTH
jgi:hypothetical protein